MSSPQTNPTAQELADAQLVDTAAFESVAAEALKRKFVRDRTAEMVRLSDVVVKPHMRSWAREWFEKHGLPVPPLDGPEGFAG
jgi:phosphoribosylaminoimidazole carboxylase (NCAIR synthetase)